MALHDPSLLRIFDNVLMRGFGTDFDSQKLLHEIIILS